MKLTKEQKEAIEFIKDLIAWDVRQDLCPNKEECENLETILNLIEKLQKENEKLKTKLLDILEGQKVIKEETPQYIKENYIQKDKIEEILSETEITDFNSLVEAFLEIKKLLESE